MPGPAHPRLTDGVVHVWRAQLSSLADGVDSSELTASLPPEERTRAARILSPRRRQMWIAAHAVLRRLLARYLDTDPRDLRFRTGKHGKPMLLDEQAKMAAHPPVGRPAVPPLAFNLSHSGELALYAFGSGGSVGVDVEVARSTIDHVAIAARALGRVQARRLAGLEPECREREFLRAWTRHEAELKCQGTGIGWVAAEATGKEPWVADLDVSPRAAGAVALERGARKLCCWDWLDGSATG
jgi:4'-phosphopantetheinyl transferase